MNPDEVLKGLIGTFGLPGALVLSFMAWWMFLKVRNGKTGKNGNGDTALNAERRTNAAVGLVVEKLDGIKEILIDHEQDARERHVQLLNLLNRHDP